MSHAEVSLRAVEHGDAEAVSAIYAPIVRDTFISFEAEPPSPAVMLERITAKQQRHPWLVATAAGRVVGYAHAGDIRLPAAYRWSAETTVYVAETERGGGVGRRLYRGLISVLRAQGFRSAFAGIALPNEASVALHEAVGFQPLGVYQEIGYKFGAWRDVGWWRLGLSNGDDPPADPIAFAELRQAPAFNDLLE